MDSTASETGVIKIVVSSEFEALSEDEHFATLYDSGRSTVLCRRKRGGPMSPEYVLAWGQQMIDEARARGHAPGTASLIIDARAAVGNADPAFERAVKESRARLVEFFAVVVNLVKTKVGEMQHHRMHDSPTTRRQSLVTSDEAEALRWAADHARRGS